MNRKIPGLYPAVMLLAMLFFQPACGTEHRLLFVGNSLTYSNDLPAMVEQAAARRGISLSTMMLAKPNYAIVDHWAEGQVQDMIRTGDYDYVIIQQGPSSQPDGYHMLVNGGQPYSQLTTAHGARLAYFMVWPSLLYYHTFDGVIANYTAGAAANDAILIPVGQVWKDHFDATRDFSYYGADGFHPSRKGSLVAAAVIVDTLFATSAANNHRQAWLTGLGQINGHTIEVDDLFITSGGRFAEGVSPADSAAQHWGGLSINFDSCHTGHINFHSTRSVAGVAFGQGRYPLSRVAPNQAGQACDVSGFADHNGHSYMAGSYYFGAARDGEGLSLDVLNDDQVIVTWYTYLPME